MNSPVLCLVNALWEHGWFRSEQSLGKTLSTVREQCALHVERLRRSHTDAAGPSQARAHSELRAGLEARGYGGTRPMQPSRGFWLGRPAWPIRRLRFVRVLGPEYEIRERVRPNAAH